MEFPSELVLDQEVDESWRQEYEEVKWPLETIRHPLVYSTVVDHGDCYKLLDSDFEALFKKRKALADFCLRCVFITLLDYQVLDSKKRVLIWRLIMQISDQDLQSKLFSQLEQRCDDMFDNTLELDEVWIRQPRPGQVECRYFIKTNQVNA